MNFRLIILLVLTVFAFKNSFSQKIEIDENDCNCKILRHESFDGNSLWGFIDGGADIFLEYGFNELNYEELEINSVKFKIEFYTMNNAEATFGIFSLFRHKCMNSDINEKFICLSKYQLIIAKDDYYISIICNSPFDSHKTESQQVINLVSEKIKNLKTFSIPEYFSASKFGNFTNDLKFFKGILGVKNICPEFETFFENISEFSMYYLSFTENEHDIQVATIIFPEPESLHIFEVNIKQSADNGLFKSNYKIQEISKNEIQFAVFPLQYNFEF